MPSRLRYSSQHALLTFNYSVQQRFDVTVMSTTLDVLVDVLVGGRQGDGLHGTPFGTSLPAQRLGLFFAGTHVENAHTGAPVQEWSVP